MQTRNVLPPAASAFPVGEVQIRTVMPIPTGSIIADPNPFSVDSGGVGQSTLSWMTTGTSKVEVRVDAPDGPLFARSEPGRFSQATGPWVRNGTTFYLQNVSGNLPLISEHTIATVTLNAI